MTIENAIKNKVDTIKKRRNKKMKLLIAIPTLDFVHVKKGQRKSWDVRPRRLTKY